MPWATTIRITSPLLRAERHADPDLAVAPPHAVGQHAVDADARQEERQAGEEASSSIVKRWCESDSPSRSSMVEMSTMGCSGSTA